jgi:hypothetical protein
MSWLQNEANRAWLYRLLLAVAAAAVVFGVVTGEESEALIAIATAALLGNGLATANTSTTSASTRSAGGPRSAASGQGASRTRGSVGSAGAGSSRLTGAHGAEGHVRHANFVGHFSGWDAARAEEASDD